METSSQAQESAETDPEIRDEMPGRRVLTPEGYSAHQKKDNLVTKYPFTDEEIDKAHAFSKEEEEKLDQMDFDQKVHDRLMKILAQNPRDPYPESEGRKFSF